MPNIAPTRSARRSTLDDVARRAGVSLITVSRVLNQHGGSAETRARVQRAVAELGYQARVDSRHARQDQSLRLALLFLRDATPSLSEILLGALAPSREPELAVEAVPCATLHDACEHARRLVHAGVDGILLPFPLCEQGELVRSIERAGVALVALGGSALQAGRSAVSANEFGAAFAMTSHLIGLGHRRIGFIKGHPAHDTSQQLLAGYRCALEAHAIAYEEALTADSLSTYRSGLTAAQALLERDERPTAIFASNDEAAAAATAVAFRAGIEIPSDLTVTGFGDTSLARAIWPALTSVRVPAELMARRAVEMLGRRVRQMRTDAASGQEQAILEGEVIRRQSDAPPRARPPCLPGGAASPGEQAGFKQVHRDHHRDGIAYAIPAAPTGDNR